jgi:hypothetical protein
MRFFSLIELLVSFLIGVILFALCFQTFLFFKNDSPQKKEITIATEWFSVNARLKEYFALQKDVVNKSAHNGLLFTFEEELDKDPNFCGLNEANIYLKGKNLMLYIKNYESEKIRKIKLLKDVDGLKIFTLQKGLHIPHQSLNYEQSQGDVILEINYYNKNLQFFLPNKSWAIL